MLQKSIFRNMHRLLLLLAVLLSLAACANLHEEETLPEEYKPEVDYTGYVQYAKGASIIIDRDTVRMKPLLPYEKYCEPDDIIYDPAVPFDRHYITYDGLGSAATEVSGGGFANAAMPNGNFLTDGVTRQKLCPDEICRADDSSVCTHINLVGGYVWGNYVYYIGKYKAEEQKSGQWNAEYENYLMRYCIPEQEAEMVARLPWFSYIAGAAYGVLYIAYVEDVPFNLKKVYHHTLIYDCENIRLTMIRDFPGIALTEAVWGDSCFYYLEGKTLRRCYYNLSGQTAVGNVENGIATLLGYAKNRVFYTLLDYYTGVISVRSLKDDGRRRTVVENCTGAALVNTGLSSYLYVIEEAEIVKYTLDRVGRGEERTVVFRESDKLDANEHILSIESVKETVYFTTEVGQYSGHTRTYLLTDHGAVLEKETGAPVSPRKDAESGTAAP